ASVPVHTSAARLRLEIVRHGRERNEAMRRTSAGKDQNKIPPTRRRPERASEERKSCLDSQSPTKIQWSISARERLLNLMVPVPGITGLEMSQDRAPYRIGKE